MRLGFLALLFLMLVTMRSQSNCWRGITPLRSTCEEVKKILKVDTCTLPISEYTVPDFRVMVEFQNETCDSEPRAWRVPKGTVTAITISPRNEMRPSEFGLDLSKYKKREDGEIVGVEHYDSEEEGVTVDLYRGFVQNLFLYPRKSEATLRCKPLK
jgi:hypothetical protein